MTLWHGITYKCSIPEKKVISRRPQSIEIEQMFDQTIDPNECSTYHDEQKFAPVGTWYSTGWRSPDPAVRAANRLSLSHPLRKLSGMVALLKPGAIRTPAAFSGFSLSPPPRFRQEPAGGDRGGDGPPAAISQRGGTGPAGQRAAVTARPLASRSHLRLVESPPRKPPARGVPVAGTAVAVAAVFGLLGLVRAVQGPPPASSWAELSGPREPVQALAGPGDQVRTARPGDTFWSLARELAPGRDPRPVVDRLVAANGGSSIMVGQQLVIPADLLAADEAG